MDYKNGKIYKIIDNAYTKMYIGSTTQPLYKRFSRHKKDYELWKKGEKWKNGKEYKITSFCIFDEFGIENCKIELIEEYQCDNKNQLERKEGDYIKNNECVNKNIAGRTRKEYYEDTKKEILEKAKEYYVDNKIKKIEYQKKYTEQNKDNVYKYQKQYYKENREKKLEDNKIKIECECGSKITKNMKSKHLKSKKHIKFLEA